MTSSLKIITVFVLVHSFLNAQSGELQFEHFSADQGLSANTVLCMLQDSRGFLWIGTYDGLNKYDGYNFTIFRHLPDDSTSISHNTVYSICEDRAGNLWIGTDGGGLNKFDRESEKFTIYKHNPDDSTSLSNNKVYSIIEDYLGVLWIGTDGGGLNKLVPDDKEVYSPVFIQYTHNPKDPASLSNDKVFKIYMDSRKELWIGTREGGLNKLTPANEQDDRESDDNSSTRFIHYKHDPNNPKSISNNGIVSICEDKNHEMWIGTAKGLNKFDRLKEEFIHYTHNPQNLSSISSNSVYTICEDKFGEFWIGTYDGGLNKFDKETKKFTRHLNNLDDPLSLSDNGVFSILVDNSGVIWIGTWSGGLNKCDPKKKPFKHVAYD